MFKYYREAIQLVNPNGYICHISGWTKPEAVEIKDNVLSIGPLYTKQGINYIIRNLYLNPSVKWLVINGVDLSGSMQFFVDWLSSEYVRHDIFEKEIDDDHLQYFHSYFSKHWSDNYDNIKVTNDWIDLIYLFKDPVIDVPQKLPSEQSGFIVRDNNLNQLYLKILDRILKFGVTNKDTRELLSLTAIWETKDLVDVSNIPDWYPFTTNRLTTYINSLLTDKAPPGVSYTYGQRIYQQVQDVIKQLRRDKTSRRYYVTTWQLKDLHDSQPPCLCSAQVYLYNNKLYLTAYFRSNDMFGAWLLNIIALRHLQHYICHEAGVEIGYIITHSNSAHIYNRDIPSADVLLKYKQLECVNDPRGNWLINYDKFNNELHATLIDPVTSNKLLTFIGTNAHEIRDQIYLYVSDITHAMYLGSELTRAEYCMKHNIPYIQE